MSYTLTSRRVTAFYKECLIGYKEEEQESVKVEGIAFTAVFHVGRLKAREGDIMELLAELPEKFQQVGGGGSFLDACFDRLGNHWTSLHQVVEQLFLLGMAIDKVTCLAPREMWMNLPDGMPYYVVN